MIKRTNRTHTRITAGQRPLFAVFFAAALTILLFPAPLIFATAFAGDPGNATGVNNALRPQELSILDGYLGEAARNNPELKRLGHTHQASLEMIPQAGALPDPEINIGYFINPDDPDTFAGRFSVSAMQMFPWYRTRQTREEAQRFTADAQLYALQDRRAAIFSDIQKAWFDYTAIALSIDVIEENRALVADLESVVRVRYETARASTADLLRIQMEDSRLKTRIENLKDQKNAVRAGFNELLNRDAESAIETPDRLPRRRLPGSEEALADLVRQNNPELDELDARISAADERTRLARLEGRPTIGVGLEIMGRDFTAMTMMPDMNEGYVAMVSISLPIYRGSYDAKVRQALEEKQAASQGKAQLSNRLSRQTQEALVDWRKSQRDLELIDEELIPKTRHAFDVLQEEYGAGNIGFEEVLQIRRELLDLQLARIEAITAQNKSMAQIEYLFAAELGR